MLDAYRTASSARLRLANATGRTVYDSLYLALAIRLKIRMVTADDRLVTAMAAFPMAAAHIVFVQTFEG